MSGSPMRGPLSWTAGIVLAAAMPLLGAAYAQGQNPSPENAMEQILAPATAVTLLRAPAAMDNGSKRVIGRAEAAYRKLKSLKTVNRDGGLTGIAYVSRPLKLHLEQKLISGELVAIAVSDGADYYEYRHRTKQYLQRSAASLRDLALPVNLRLFVEGQHATEVLKGLDDKPTVREYEYRYRGKVRIPGGPTERVDVSVMVRSPDGKWHAFTSQRFYDATSGLLRRAVNGGRTMDIENFPNAPVPQGKFRWVPPAGSIKGLG